MSNFGNVFVCVFVVVVKDVNFFGVCVFVGVVWLCFFLMYGCIGVCIC